MQIVELFIGPVAVAAIISGVITMYTTNKTNKLEYITKERSTWREEIRKCSEELYCASYQNTRKICNKLKNRINAYGKRGAQKYIYDTHIWEIIESIEVENFKMEELKKYQSALQEYLDLLLKWDWERTKREVIGEKIKGVYYILWIISEIMYAGILIYEYKMQHISVINVILGILINTIVVSMFICVELHIKKQFLIELTEKRIEKKPHKKYTIITILGCVVGFIASLFYAFFLLGFMDRVDRFISDYAYKIGRYLGWYYNQNHKGRIIIGKDTRRSSYMFGYALVAGIMASGGRCIFATYYHHTERGICGAHREF